MPLPTLLAKEIYDAISNDTSLTHTERQLFSKWYTLESRGEQLGAITGTIEGNGNIQCDDDTFTRIQYKLKQDYR